MPAFLDRPDGPLETERFPVVGWVASQSKNPAIQVRVSGASVPFELFDRPDVRKVYPEFSTVTGVSATANLPGKAPDEPILVEIECDGEVTSRVCPVLTAPPPPPSPTADGGLRERARLWCLERLRCPTCGAGAGMLTHAPTSISCQACGVRYLQQSAALNLISGQAGIVAGVTPSENVSSNPYTPDALALISTTVANGGWVLDCGAGSRPERLSGVINLEIADYPSTDVLAIGEALPFADNSFDAVLSLAVLEHVRDPFTCAREIVRVLKPGGELLADVPFLQPVHGYPNHYYNMTPAGLKNLFAGLGEVIDCRVPLHGHPIFAVQWLLGAYMAGLPERTRGEFGALTVGEAASLSPHAFLPSPAAMELAMDTQAVIGCVNSLRFRK